MKEIKKKRLSEADMSNFAAKLAKICEEGIVLFLQGQLGAGKTTFARGFLRGMGYEHKVKSPTYTLVESYTVGGFEVYHFDLYRLGNNKELEYIGLSEYFSPNSVCLVEWPEKGEGFLPQADLICHIDVIAEKRNICIRANSSHGEHMISRLKSLYRGYT